MREAGPETQIQETLLGIPTVHWMVIKIFISEILLWKHGGRLMGLWEVLRRLLSERVEPDGAPGMELS